MIEEERLTKALEYLAKTDESCARAHALMIGIDRQTKTIEGQLFIQMPPEMKVAEKDARVFASQTWVDHNEKYQNAVADYEIMRNRRDTAALIVEVWRSENANRRKGNL